MDFETIINEACNDIRRYGWYAHSETGYIVSRYIRAYGNKSDLNDFEDILMSDDLTPTNSLRKRAALALRITRRIRRQMDNQMRMDASG